MSKVNEYDPGWTFLINDARGEIRYASIEIEIEIAIEITIEIAIAVGIVVECRLFAPKSRWLLDLDLDFDFDFDDPNNLTTPYSPPNGSRTS